MLFPSLVTVAFLALGSAVAACQSRGFNPGEGEVKDLGVEDNIADDHLGSSGSTTGEKLQAKGYTFVAMDKNTSAVEKIGKVKADKSGTEFGTFSFASVKKGPAKYEFAFKVIGATRLEVTVDGFNGILFQGAGDFLRVTNTFNKTGVRFFTLRGFDSSGNVVGQVSRSVNIEP
ncbi:MAG: hypothetical protein IOD12_09570 [Silvanigrellales bacterium]|nr:hypothetical protein [Silvanigrellales bacterium]